MTLEMLSKFRRAASEAGYSVSEHAVQVAVIGLCGDMLKVLAVKSAADDVLYELRQWRRSER